MPNFRDSASSCDICLEPYRDRELHRLQHVLVPCGHMYCRSCVEGLNGRCPSCREPIQQHIRVWHEPPRDVSDSQLLLDAKENVRKTCTDLNKYQGLGNDFGERIDDLLALCVPKEESEDRIIPVLQAIERLVSGFKDANAIAARETHRMTQNVRLARENQEARHQALTEILLDDVEVLNSKLDAYKRAFPVTADMPRVHLSKRESPIVAPDPIFGHVDPLAPGLFYYVGPPPGRGVKLGRSARMSGSPRTSREQLLQSYLERVQDKMDRAEQEAAARRNVMPDYAQDQHAGTLLLDVHDTRAGSSLGDALGLQQTRSPIGLDLGFDRGEPLEPVLFR